jgi:hypothetical protein
MIANRKAPLTIHPISDNGTVREKYFNTVNIETVGIVILSNNIFITVSKVYSVVCKL